jgi:3-oxoacyl-[acyl-carrier protein] reductase
MSLLDLDGRVAVVTGASRGIGLAIASLLADHGAHVVLSSRSDVDKLHELAVGLSACAGRRCLGVQADVRQRSQVAQLYQTVFKQFKRLDILVNNAGILGDGLLGMIPESTIQDTLATNVEGAIHNLQAAAHLMRRSSEDGAVVNVSSIIGNRGNVGQSVYGASKAALIGLTLSAAKELAPYRVRVNAVCPGYIDTDMIAHLPPEIHEQRLSGIAMGRIGKPVDVANVVLFLVSDLSAYVTGQVIGVDGGMVI